MRVEHINMECASPEVVAPYFKSRVLSYYYSNLPDNKSGCFFYVAEHNCLCILDTPYRKGDSAKSFPQIHASEIEAAKDCSTHIAHGLPAILWTLNERDEPALINGVIETYVNTKSYLSIEDLYQDWLSFLQQTQQYVKHFCWNFSTSHIHWLGNIIKQIFQNQYANLSVENVLESSNILTSIVGISHNLYLSFVPNATRNQMGFCVSVLVDTLTDVHNALTENVWAAFGLPSVLINCAVLQYFNERWKQLSFTDVEAVQHYFDIIERRCQDVISINDISFNSDFNYKKIFQTYLDKIVPNVLKYIQCDPTYPIELSEGNNIYSYILWAEKTAFQVFIANQLYASFTREQQNQLQTFFRRYLEYLSKNYGANEELMNRINMREYGHIEPLQISFTSHIQVTDKDGNDVTLERARADGWVVPKTEIQNKKKNAKIIHSFASSIQNVDADKFLTYLHKKIDGNGGKEVACILGAAIYKYHYLSRVPSETEFMAEFPNISSTWKAIKHQLNKHLNDGKDSFTQDCMLVDITL